MKKKYDEKKIDMNPNDVFTLLKGKTKKKDA